MSPLKGISTACLSLRVSASAATLKRLKQAAQGVIRSCSSFSAQARFRAGSAIERNSLVECAELAPQQLQSDNSCNSMSRLLQTASIDSPYSRAVPSSEQPGKKETFMLFYAPLPVQIFFSLP